MSFAQLQAELARIEAEAATATTLAKSASFDPDEDPDEDGPDLGDDDDEGEDETLGKAMSVTFSNGETLSGRNGAELLKAMAARADNQETVLASVLGAALDTIKQQQEAIAAQGAQVAQLGTLVKSMAAANRGPRGRLSDLTILPKPDPAGSGAAPKTGVEMLKSMTPAQILTLAEAKAGEGKLSYLEVATLENSIGAGLPSEAILAKLAS